jgi:hypothetical protein
MVYIIILIYYLAVILLVMYGLYEPGTVVFAGDNQRAHLKERVPGMDQSRILGRDTLSMNSSRLSG